VVRCDQRWDLCNQPHPGAQSVIHRLIARTGVQRAERRDARPQHLHGVCIPQRADELDNSRRERAVGAELGVERIQVGSARQLAVQ
jgi:hypothetical protein